MKVVTGSKYLITAVLVASMSLMVACSKRDSKGNSKAKAEQSEQQKKIADLEKESKKAQEEAKAALAEAKATEEKLKEALAAAEAAKDERDAALADVEGQQASLKAQEDALMLQAARVKKQVEAAENSVEAANRDRRAQQALVEQAKQDLETAKQEAEAARTEAGEVTEEAQAKLEDAQAKLEAANAANEQAQAREEQSQSILENAQSEQERVNDARVTLQGVFQERGLDTAFQKIMEEGDMDSDFTFLVTVIGKPHYDKIKEIRAQMEAVATKSSSELSPKKKSLESVIQSIQADEALQARQDQGEDLDMTEAANLFHIASNERNLFDRYLMSANARKLQDLRNSLNAGDDAYVVVRFVEKMQVSLKLDVYTREHVEAKRSEKELSVALGTVEIEGIQDIGNFDVTKPGQYVLGNSKASCETITPACVRELNEKGLLDERVAPKMFTMEYALGMQGVPAKQVLKKMLVNSAEGLDKYVSEIDNGRAVSSNWSFFTGIFSSDGETREVLDDEGNWVEVEVEQEDAEEKETPYVSKVQVSYEVSMIEELPSDGRVSVDLVMNKGTLVNGKISHEDLVAGSFGITLPIGTLSDTELDFDKEGEERSANETSIPLQKRKSALEVSRMQKNLVDELN